MRDDLTERVARAIYAEADRQKQYVGEYRFPRGESLDTTLDGEFDLRKFAAVAIRETLREVRKCASQKIGDVVRAGGIALD